MNWSKYPSGDELGIFDPLTEEEDSTDIETENFPPIEDTNSPPSPRIGNPN